MSIETYIQEAQKWLEWDTNPLTRQETETMISTRDEKSLKACFGKRMMFGTAGLRGKMRTGINCMNNLTVQQASQGLSITIDQHVPNGKSRGILIGYDGRHHSAEFAEIVARVFVKQGFKTYLFSQMVPTPWVAYGCEVLKTAAGVMVTASHNPKDDNGYKVYWDNAVQIIEPIDSYISNNILANLAPWDISDVNLSSTIDPLETVSNSYYEKMMQTIPKFVVPKEPKLTYVYTPMHGVGSPYVQEAFKHAGLPAPLLVPLQDKANPNFDTVPFPNPEEGKGALKLSIEVAEQHGATLILANDPDADRLSVAVKVNDGWKQFSGNEIATLLADYTYKKHVESGDTRKPFMVRSTVSSAFIDVMGREEGFETYETLTGFKWIGNKGKELVEKEGKKQLMSFEEAIGFIIGDMSFDKDGVRTAVTVAAMALEYAENGIDLYQQMEKIVEKYGYLAMNAHYYFCYDPNTLVKIFTKMRNNGEYCWKYGRFAVKNIRDLTVGVDTAQPDKKPVLPVSASSQMITYTFENGCIATIRGSGTEPKLKYYIELPGKKGQKKEEVIAEVMELSKVLLETCLEPKVNGLVDPPPKD